MLAAIFPNASKEDFVLQKVRAYGNATFVSLIRKDVLETIINDFSKVDLYITKIFLGPFAIASLLPVININSLRFKNHFLVFNQGFIQEYTELEEEQAQEKIVIGEKTIDPNLLLSFSAAFTNYIDYKDIAINSDLLLKSKEEYKNKTLFKKLVWISTTVFFIILLINFFLFNHYFNKRNELNNKLFVNNEVVAKYSSLKKELDEKKLVIEKLNLNESSTVSYYADRLAIDMPSSILLTKLSIYPHTKKEIAGKYSYDFSTNSILLEGSCSKSAEINDWINVLNEKNWIKKVELQNYIQGKDSERGVFTIGIKL